MGNMTTEGMLLFGGSGILVGAILVFIINQISAKSTLSSARKESAQLLSNAEREAATVKKESRTELKERENDLLERMEKDGKRQRDEIQNLENRVVGKEETLDKRASSLDQKIDSLNSREKDLDRRKEGLDTEKGKIQDTINEQILVLERISGMTIDAAKKMIIEKLENEVRRETALRLKKLEDEMINESEKKANKVLADSIQRCASDHIAEHSVSVVALPSEEMKGRIIGREGRNIRALETATGINLIVDDTQIGRAHV